MYVIGERIKFADLIYSSCLDEKSYNIRSHLCDINILMNMQLLPGKHFVKLGSLTSIATLMSVSSSNVVTVLATILFPGKCIFQGKMTTQHVDCQ